MHTPWQKNIRIVFSLRICFALIFSVSVITLFWKKYGLDLFDIFWLQAIFAVVIVIFEIPSGYLSDRLGRKKTLLLASLFAAIGWFFYSLATSFSEFVLAEIILGLAFSLLSGTDSSLVYESLNAQGKDQSFTRIEGRQQSASLIAEAVAAGLGGWLAMVLPLEYTLAASGLATLVAFMVCWGITEPARQPYIHPRGTWYGLYKIARYVFLRSHMVKWAVPLMAGCSLSTMLGVWLYQPLWQEKQVPLYLFGLLWAALAIPSSFTSHFADQIETKVGRKQLLWLLPFPAVIGYLVLAWAPGLWALLGAYLVNVVRGLTLPVLCKYIHQETFSDKRVTVLSINSWLFRVAYFALGPVIGWIGQHYHLSLAFLTCAVISAVGTFVFIPAFIHSIETYRVPEFHSPDGSDRPA